MNKHDKVGLVAPKKYYKGRKKGSIESPDKFLTKAKVKKIKVLLGEGMGVRKISSVVECNPNFIYKVKGRIGV